MLLVISYGLFYQCKIMCDLKKASSLVRVGGGVGFGGRRRASCHCGNGKKSGEDLKCTIQFANSCKYLEIFRVGRVLSKTHISI